MSKKTALCFKYMDIIFKVQKLDTKEEKKKVYRKERNSVYNTEFILAIAISCFTFILIYQKWISHTKPVVTAFS